MAASGREDIGNSHVQRNMASFCVEFLAADDRARQSGAPLLTEAGVQYCLQLSLGTRDAIAMVALIKSSNVDAGGHDRLPRWDAETRRLWLGGVLLKEFRQPAPNQVALLDAFEARGWSSGHVRDPLPRSAGESESVARDRLHETIKSLNRAMPVGTIHFRADGSGHGVRWECSENDGQFRRNGAGKGKP